MCFYSNKEALRENPGKEKIIENHITNPYVGTVNALGCSMSACPVVIDITAIDVDAICTISFDQISRLWS